MQREIVDTVPAKKILTIRGPLCYRGRTSEAQGSGYHGLIRKIGFEMRKNRNNFFHTSYPELVRAHATGDKRDMNRLCRKLQVDLRPYAAKLASNYRFTTIDLDDFIQEGLIAVCKYLPEYRYICPECKERFGRIEDYSEHCKDEHGYLMEAVPNIRNFLSGVIRGYMLNYLRHQFQRKRTPLMVIHSSDFIETNEPFVFIDSVTPSPEELVASKESVEKIKECLDRERNEKIREFVVRILEGATMCEAYVGISNAGLTASPESARMIICRLRRQNPRAFAKYREALVG